MTTVQLQLWTFLIPVWVSIKNSRMVLSEHYYKKHDYALWNADGGKTSTYCCACCDQQELHVRRQQFSPQLNPLLIVTGGPMGLSQTNNSAGVWHTVKGSW